MGLIQNIIGIVSDVLQIGLTGPKIKNNAGVLQARNNADSAFNRLQVATPTAADDATTKNYVDTLPSSSTTSVKQMIFSVANVSSSSVAVLPANSVIVETAIEVTAPYDPGATLSVGIFVSSALFMNTTENNPQVTNTYANTVQNVSIGGAPAAIYFEVLGAPLAGAGNVLVKYVEVPVV